MSKKAVDIVLLPDGQMMDKAIQANAELVKRFGERIVLNSKNCLPHISFAMGCIDERQVGDIKDVLKEIAEGNPLGDLEISGVAAETNAVGRKVSSFQVRKTEKLQRLHKDVMNKLEVFLKYDVTEDMLYGDEKKAESTLIWIKDYREKSGFSKFWPHITIGYGQSEDSPPKAERLRSFSVNELAICHLGNHCTCRKVLASVPI